MTIRKTRDGITPDLERIKREFETTERRALKFILERAKSDSQGNSQFWRPSRTTRGPRGGLHPIPAVRGKLTARTRALKGSVLWRIVKGGKRMVGWHYLGPAPPRKGGTAPAEYGTILAKRNPAWDFLNRGLRLAAKKTERQVKAIFDKLMKG